MTYPPTPDLPLLRKVVDLVAQLPAVTRGGVPSGDSWRQATWGVQLRAGQTCGTACCVAGWTVQLVDGYEPCWVRWEEATSGQLDPDVAYLTGVRGPDGQRQTVRRTARDLLGLTDEEAHDLFHATNSLADVRRVAAAIAARGGETWTL